MLRRCCLMLRNRATLLQTSQLQSNHLRTLATSRIHRSDDDDASSWIDLLREDFNKQAISSPESEKLLDAISQAENLTGYPTSFLGLKFLLKDEISNLASHVRKLIATRHPVILTAKDIISNNQQQLRGLIVSLAGKSIDELKLSQRADIPSSRISKMHRDLAEITDMIHLAHLVHQCVLSLPEYKTKSPSSKNTEPKNLLHELNLGNQIAILIGDYLLATSSKRLAALRNPSIVSLMSQPIRDTVEAEFLDDKVCYDNEDDFVEALEERSYLSGGSLLAHGCKAAALIAGCDESNCLTSDGLDIKYNADLCASIEDDDEMTTADLSFNIGRHIGCAMQFNEYLKSGTYHLTPSYQSTNSESSAVILKRLADYHIGKSLQLMDSLTESDSRQALRNLIYSLIDERSRTEILKNLSQVKTKHRQTIKKDKSN